jgi:two-component system, sensor histidine kinase YesM
LGRVKDFIGSRSLRFKLLIYFLLLILLPIAVLGILGNVIYSRSIEAETNIHTNQMIAQVQENVEFYIKDMENVIRYLSQEPDIEQFLQIKSSADSNRVSVETELRRILKAFSDIHPEISGILVVNENDIYISNDMYRITRDPLITEAWYKQAIDHPDVVQLISRPVGRNIKSRFNYGADDVLSIVRAVKDPSSGQFKGVIIIDMKLSTVEKIISKITLGKSGFLFIMD